MVGRKVALTVTASAPSRPGKPVMELSGFSLREGDQRHSLKNLNFSVRAGEVVGIAGVEGNGQSELLQLLLHPHDHLRKASGQLKVHGESALRWSSAHVRASGVGIIPEDRHREGLLLEEPLTENFLLGLHEKKPFTSRGFISGKAVLDGVRRAIREYDVRPADAFAVAGRLSGGNQQKLIIAREFETRPRFLIAAQPTRGVDVGAIEFIHSRILRARDEGTGILLVSSELDEVMALSDRILVMYEGAIVAEFSRSEYDENQIGLRMGGSS
jgi:simple sugar transport system ATP-binding protein